jgi:tripeptide aminopeptidase
MKHLKRYEGFSCITNGISAEETVLELIIRDHNKIKFEKRKEKVAKIVRKINKKFTKKFGEDIAIAEINDQYYNMKEKVVPVNTLSTLPKSNEGSKY